VLLTVAAALLMVSHVALRAASDPWTSTQTVQPADLLKELSDSKSAPTIVFVGFNRLYTAGHIKGAQNHGMAGNEAACWNSRLGPPRCPAPPSWSSIAAAVRWTAAPTSVLLSPRFAISASPNFASSSCPRISPWTGLPRDIPTIGASNALALCLHALHGAIRSSENPFTRLALYTVTLVPILD